MSRYNCKTIFQNLTATLRANHCWVTTTHSFRGYYQLSKRICHLYLSETGSTRFLRNVGNHLQNYTVSQRRILQSKTLVLYSLNNLKKNKILRSFHGQLKKKLKSRWTDNVRETMRNISATSHCFCTHAKHPRRSHVYKICSKFNTERNTQFRIPDSVLDVS
jgi:hypothetical protein